MPGNPTINAVSNPGESVVAYGGASITPINLVSVIPAVISTIQPSENLTPSIETPWPTRQFAAESIERFGPQRILNTETRIALYQAEQAIQSALNTLSNLGANLMGAAQYSVKGTPGNYMRFLDNVAALNLPAARLTILSNALRPLNAAEAAVRALPNPFVMPLTAASVNRFLGTLNSAQGAIGQAEAVLPALFNLANEGFWRGAGVAPQEALNLIAYGQLASSMLSGLGRAQLAPLTAQVGYTPLARSLGGTHIFQGPAARYLRLGNEINETITSAVQALQSLNVNAFREALGGLRTNLAQFVSDLPTMTGTIGPFRAAELALMAGQLGVPTAASALQGVDSALQLYVNQLDSATKNMMAFTQALQQFSRMASQWSQVNVQGSQAQAYTIPLARPISTGPSNLGLSQSTVTHVNVPAQAQQAVNLAVQLGNLASGLYSTISNYAPQLNNEVAQLSQTYSQLTNAWNSYISAVNSGNYGEALRALQELASNYGQIVNGVNTVNNLINEIANSAVPYLQQLGNTLSQELGGSLGRVTSGINEINNLLSSSNFSALLMGSLTVTPTGRLSPQVVIGSNAVNLTNFVQGVRQLQLNAQNLVGQLHNIINALQNAQNDPVQALMYGISLLNGGAQQIASFRNNLNTLSSQLSLMTNTLSEYVNAGRAVSGIGNLPAEIESGLTNVGKFFADLGVDFKNFVSGLSSGNMLIGLRNDLSQMDRLIANMGLNLSSMRMIDIMDAMASFDTLIPMLAPVAGTRLLSQTSSLVNSVDAFITSARSLLAQVQTALSEGLSLAQVAGSNTWVALYNGSRTAIYDLLKGVAIGLGGDAQLLGQALGNIPQLRGASNFLLSHGNWLINWKPPESIVNAVANMLAYSVPVVGPLSHLAAYWNQESDLEKLFDVVMAGLSAFMMFDALDNFTAGFYRSLADIVAQEARASGGSVDVLSFLAQNPGALARAFMAGINTMFAGGVIKDLPGLLTTLKNIAVSVGFSEAFTLGMAAAEHMLNTNDLTTLLISGAMLGILTYAMSTALGITEEAALNLLANPSLRSGFQDVLTSVLTRFGDVIGISADEAPELAANATNSLFRVLSSNAFRAIATRVLEFNNAGLINAGIAYAAANGRLSREQLWNDYLQGVLYGLIFFAGTQYFANMIATIRHISALPVYLYGDTPFEGSELGFRSQLSFVDAAKAVLLSGLGVPFDEALQLATGKAAIVVAPLSGFDPEEVIKAADALYGHGNYIIVENAFASGEKNLAMVLPNVKALAEGDITEISADQLTSEDFLSTTRTSIGPGRVGVLVYSGAPDEFYYFATRMDYLGGREVLGEPLAKFYNPEDLLSYLRTVQDPQDLMILTNGVTFEVYPRSFYLPQVDNGGKLIIVDNDSMSRLLEAFNLIRGGGVVGGGTVDVLNREPVFLLRDPAGRLIMTIGYDSLAKPIDTADVARLMLGEGIDPSDVGYDIEAAHATASLPAQTGGEFTTEQSRATPYRTAAANNFYVAPGLLIRGAVVGIGDDGTIENVISQPSWLRLGYYFYLGARNESLAPGVPGRGNFIVVRGMPFVDPSAAGRLSFSDLLTQYEQIASYTGAVMRTPALMTPYENVLATRGRIPGLYSEFQLYVPSAGEVPYYISVSPDDPNFYRYIGTALDPTGGNARYAEIIDSDGNVIASGRVDDPADLGRFIFENANKIQPGYVIQVADASPDNALNFLANGTWHSVYVDNSLAAQLRELANGGNLAISMFNGSGAPAFKWGVALYNMEGGEAGITQAFIPDVKIGDATVTLGVEFDEPLSQDKFSAFVQALRNAASPDDVINTLNENGARIEMARIDNNIMFFNNEAAPDGETFINTLLTGGVDALRGMASNVRLANDDFVAYTLWIRQQARGWPTPLNPAETANLRFMSWANGGEPYLNATLYDADTGSFYDFYMRPGANIGLGNEVQENGMYYSGAYGLISELSNVGRGSPSPWGELENFLGRLAGELVYGLTGNYVPVGVVMGTPRGAYVPRSDVFLGQGIEETPRAVMPMEETQMPVGEAQLQAQAALARPLAYIAPTAVEAQLAEGAEVSAAQPATLENIERAVPALRSLGNMATALLQLGTEGFTAQAAEALQAERGGTLTLPQFSEALGQAQVRNVQPGQALAAEIVTPQAASLEQANITPREAGPAVQQLGQAEQTVGQEVLQPGQQVGQLGQAQRGYAVQPVQQLAQPIAELQTMRAGQEVQVGQQEVRLGQAQQVIGQSVQAERGYEAQPYGQVAAQGYEAQPAQQAVQPQAEQAQGYQAQPYGREQAQTERPQLTQQQAQAQLYQPQPYQAQVGYQLEQQPAQYQPVQQVQQAQGQAQQAQQSYEQVQQELQQLEQNQEQTPILQPNALLSIFTQPTAPRWFNANRAPERRAYLKEVLAL